MAKTALDPRRLEQEARALFADLGAPPPAAYDDTGRPVEVTTSARFTEINRRARLIAISDALAQAVVALLGEHGLQAAVDHMRIDPAAEGDEQVLAIRCTVGGIDAVVPVRPGNLQLRTYPVGTEIVLTGDPLMTAEVPTEERERDGWVSATAITAVLREHLNN